MRRLLTMLGSALALSLAGVLAFPETLLIFPPGEKKNVWLEVSERDGNDFTIDTATYWILDETGATAFTEAAATISGTRIYSSVDAATWTESSEYHLWVRWGVTETDEIYINIVRISCGEEWE